MRRSYCWMAFVSILLATASVNGTEKSKYYSIKMDDKLIGYAVISSESVTRDGKQLILLKSITSLKVALLGKQRNVTLDSETLLDSQTQRPVSYRLTSTTNEVVAHVDSEFADRSVSTWSYRGGDLRGEPVVSELPETEVVILGNNNFAHWNQLLNEATRSVVAGKALVTVFVPETQQTESLELVRGELTEFALATGKRKVVNWNVEKAQMELAADAGTNDFLRMYLRQQKTTVELAEESVVKLVGKSRAEELLANHFIQSNITFDDFLKVTRLEATLDVEVIGSGIENDVAVLTTGMQEFEGERKSNKIAGTVTVASVDYAGNDSPAFPAPVSAAVEGQWLEPSACIESDCEPIAAKSAELTRGASTRWEAVLQVGKWVHKEITYTIADTPSARLALEKKKGDCGPHSTLTIALLRAAGIPARLVGGLVYTPSLGGSFGQHAWVEVHMGAAGWVAVDPTTGEFERMSATHIKLFEGMGGVKPKTITVTAYQPANRAIVTAPPAEARPLAWKLDAPYTFQYRKGDKELGEETFTIVKTERDGVSVLDSTSDVKLKINLLSSFTSNTKLTVAPNAKPLAFSRDFSVLLKKTKIECAFGPRKVEVEISGSQSLSREIQLPEGVLCFDNNLMSCWVLICSQLRLELDKPLSIRTFHTSSLQIIPLTITPIATAPLKIDGQEVECFECEVAPIKNKFWITRDGRFVRATQGDLDIKLKGVE